MTAPQTALRPKDTVYRGAFEVFRLRTARKGHSCDYSRDSSWYRACKPIQAGEQYVHVTVFPGHDFVRTEHPITGACCLACAGGYTGMDQIVPTPNASSDPPVRKQQP